MLAFVMIMTNSSMTALAATVGSVVETEAAKEAGPFVYEDELVRVTATLQEGVTLPAGTALTVTSAEEAEGMLAALADGGQKPAGVTGLRFGFVSESGETVVPEGNVDIYAEFLQPVLMPDTEEAEGVQTEIRSEVRAYALTDAAEEMEAEITQDETGAVTAAALSIEGSASVAFVRLETIGERVFTYEDSEVAITVTVPEGVVLPENAELQAYRVEEESKEFEEVAEKTEEDVEEIVLKNLIYNIRFLCGRCRS